MTGGYDQTGLWASLPCEIFKPARANRIGHRIVSMKLRAAVAVVARCAGIANVCAAWRSARRILRACWVWRSRRLFRSRRILPGTPVSQVGAAVSRPAPFSGQSRFAGPAFGRLRAPGFAGTRVPYRGSGLAARRPLYRPAYGDRSGRAGTAAADADHGSPGHMAMVIRDGVGTRIPFVIDPGFYDWGDSGDSDYGSGMGLAANQGYADLAPYPGYGDAPEPAAGTR